MALTFEAIPLEITHSRTPLWFTASSDAVGVVKIRLELYQLDENELIFKTVNLQVDINGEVSFNFSKIVTDQLGKNVPVLNVAGNDDAGVFKYYVRAVSIVNGVEGLTANSATRYSIFGENTFFLQEYQYVAIDLAKTYHFLSAKPLERELYEDQEEVLSVLFTAAIALPVLNVKIVYTDGSFDTYNSNLAAATKAGIRTFDLSFRANDWTQYQDPRKPVSRLEVKITGTGVVGDTVVYKVQNSRSSELKSYIFANRFGGFDVLAATGLLEENEAIEGEVFLNDKNVTGIKQKPRVQTYNQYSGWLPKSEAYAYSHMRDVNRVWMVIKDQQLASLTMAPKSYALPNDNENINGFAFSFTFGDGRQDFDTINATQFILTGGEMSLPINMTDVTGLVAALAAKVDLSPPTVVADSATPTFDCTGKEASKFSHTTSSTSSAVSITNIIDGGIGKVLPLIMNSVATFNFTITSAGLTVLVGDTGSNVLSIANASVSHKHEFIFERSGSFLYVFYIKQY
uniref:hypothetical protein n=1 Tax=Roseivirga sp. TaxID=1964215 RepID=UPI0040471EF1